MSTYLYLQKYRNTMYSKIKNYTTMFTKYTLPLGPICTSLLVCFEWYVCDIYIFILVFFFFFSFGLPSPKKVFRQNQGSLSFFTLTSPARMVAISPCMKAHGTFEPTRGHFSPLGQYTSPVAPCCFMLSLEHGKQNLCEGTDGH